MAEWGNERGNSGTVVTVRGRSVQGWIVLWSNQQESEYIFARNAAGAGAKVLLHPPVPPATQFLGRTIRSALLGLPAFPWPAMRGEGSAWENL